MNKIHLKREAGVPFALCGIQPDKERSITMDLVTNHKPDEICKVCLKVFETAKKWASPESDT